MGVREARVSRCQEGNTQGPEVRGAAPGCIRHGSPHVPEHRRQDGPQDRPADQVLPLPWDDCAAPGALPDPGQLHQDHRREHTLRSGHHDAGYRRSREVVRAQDDRAQVTEDAAMK